MSKKTADSKPKPTTSKKDQPEKTSESKPIKKAVEAKPTSTYKIEPPTPKNDPVSFERFRNAYKTLAALIGLLAFFVVANFVLLFAMAWAVGNQLNAEQATSYGGRLAKVEEKADAIIETLPAQFRPKLDLEVVRPDQEVDRWKGDKDNRYVWIKYSDLECPYCSAIQPELNSFLENNSDQASLIFRNFPLNNIHPNAQRLAETAECVARSNGESAYWNFIEGVYYQEIPTTVEGQEQLSTYVENSSQVSACVENREVREKVQRDLEDGLVATVSGTPTFILYDMQTDETKFVQNPGSSEGFEQVLEDFRAKQE